MAIRLEATRRFEATSPVARYWLTHCKGFRVVGARKGTVEEVVSRSDPHVPELLVVRDLYRRREVPISEVEAVVPAEQLIVLGDPIAVREKRRRRRPARAAARAASRPVVSALGAVVEQGRPRVRRLAVATRRTAVATGVSAVALGRMSKSLALGVRRAAVIGAAFGMVVLRGLSAFVRASIAAAASFVEAYRSRIEGPRRR